MLLLSLSFLLGVFGVDPDVGKDMVQIVTSFGYPIETHHAQTQDGYILGLFRIPFGRDEPKHNKPKPVAFLQHGLLDSSFTWVSNFPKESLGYILADRGYDVWFGNSRGNFYSCNHILYPNTTALFWNFTFDDMARHDLPAAFDYVLKATNQTNLSYVGHSQGTTQAFAGFSLSQKLSSKVNLFVALAPATYVHHAGGLLAWLGMLDLDEFFLLFGVNDFLPDATFLQRFAPEFCYYAPWACADALMLIAGPTNHLNSSRIDVYVAQTPAGTSTKNMAHWAQGIRGGQFEMYDYGCGWFSCPNMDHYGQKTPPQYQLENVKIPTAIYFGGNDILADPLDVGLLLEQLPAETVVHKSYLPTYGHLDFTWAQDANQLIYSDVVSLLQKYNP